MGRAWARRQRGAIGLRRTRGQEPGPAAASSARPGAGAVPVRRDILRAVAPESAGPLPPRGSAEGTPSFGEGGGKGVLSLSLEGPEPPSTRQAGASFVASGSLWAGSGGTSWVSEPGGNPGPEKHQARVRFWVKGCGSFREEEAAYWVAGGLWVLDLRLPRFLLPEPGWPGAAPAYEGVPGGWGGGRQACGASEVHPQTTSTPTPGVVSPSSSSSGSQGPAGGASPSPPLHCSPQPPPWGGLPRPLLGPA